MSGKKLFVTAASLVPASHGLWLLVSVWTLPKPSDDAAHDGTPAIVGLFYLFVVAPIAALLSCFVVGS